MTQQEEEKQMIMVNADARFAISVNVRANELKVALIDLNGEIRSQKVLILNSVRKVIMELRYQSL